MDPDMMPMGKDGWLFILTLAWPFIQEWLKNRPWFGMLSQDTKKLNAVVPALVAFFGTVGFHLEGSYAHGWVLMIPPGDALLHVAVGLMMNHGIYQKLIADPRRQRAILAILEQLTHVSTKVQPTTSAVTQ